jgi:hypothetical protein
MMRRIELGEMIYRLFSSSYEQSSMPHLYQVAATIWIDIDRIIQIELCHNAGNWSVAIKVEGLLKIIWIETSDEDESIKLINAIIRAQTDRQQRVCLSEDQSPD